jgi:probable rRNA maturation factor
MIKIRVTKQSNYPVDTPGLKRKLKEYFKSMGIVSDSQVSVSIVGEKKMLTLAKKFLNEDGVLHNVLSFRDQETKGNFVYPPGEKINLGEIIVCFPKAVEEANKENKLINDKVYELVEHGATHLMGIHHT